MSFDALSMPVTFRVEIRFVYWRLEYIGLLRLVSNILEILRGHQQEVYVDTVHVA